MAHSISSSPASARLARGLLFAYLLLSPVLFCRLVLEPFEEPKTALLVAVALALAALAWPLVRVRRLVEEPVSWAVLLLAGSAILSTVFSINPRTSVWGVADSHGGLLTHLSLAVVFFAARHVLQDRAEERRLLLAVTAASALAAGYALLQVAGLDPFAWELTSPFAGWVRPLGTLGHPNILAGFLASALPLVAYLAWNARGHRPTLLVLATAIVCCLIVIVASLSRAAWLAMVLGMSAFAAAWLTRRRLALVLGMVALVALVVVALLVFMPQSPLARRVVAIGDSSTRLHIWYSSWRIFLDRPLTGCGLDAYQFAFGAHRTVTYDRLEWGLTPTRAHNDFLHTLATQGVIGAAGLVFLAGALGLSLMRAWKNDDRVWLLALGGSMLAFIAQGCFGYWTSSSAALFLVVAALASRASALPGANQPNRAREGAVPAPHPLMFAARLSGWVAAGVACWFLVIQPLNASLSSRQGEDQRSLTPHQEAVRLAAHQSACWVKLAEGTREAALACGKPKKRAKLWTRSRAALERACALEPGWAEHHAALARVEEAMAREGLVNATVAFTSIDKALSLDPCNTAHLAAAAQMAVNLGQHERAEAYLKRGLEQAPDLPELLTEKAALALSRGNLIEAEAILRAALDSSWNGQEAPLRALGLLALTCLQASKFGEVVDVTGMILERQDDHVPARWMRACALERLGRFAEALRACDGVLHTRPDHPGALEMQRRLSGGR